MENKPQTACLERQRVGGNVISLTSPVYNVWIQHFSPWPEEALEVDFQLLAIRSYSPHAEIIGGRSICRIAG